MSERQMYLHAATNSCGSECKTEIDITESEWEALSEEAKNAVIREFLPDVCDIFVAPGDD